MQKGLASCFDYSRWIWSKVFMESFNSSSGEPGAGGTLSSRPPWCTKQTPEYLGHRKTLLQWIDEREREIQRYRERNREWMEIHMLWEQWSTSDDILIIFATFKYFFCLGSDSYWLEIPIIRQATNPINLEIQILQISVLGLQN